MARVSKHKSRKEYKCYKCGGTISKGQEYYSVQEFMKYSKQRCMKCGRPEKSELTSSEHLQALYSAQEELRKACASREIDQIIEALESAKDTAEEQEGEYQNSIDSKEEYFPGSTDDLEEKRQACEDWAGELETALDSANEYKEQLDEAVDEAEDDEVKDNMEPVEKQLEKKLGPWDTEPTTPDTRVTVKDVSADLENLIAEVEDANESLSI